MKTNSCFFKSDRISSILFSLIQKSETLYLNFLQAFEIALPELIETSLSEESPPYITPILILYPLLLEVNYQILNQHCKKI